MCIILKFININYKIIIYKNIKYIINIFQLEYNKNT